MTGWIDLNADLGEDDSPAGIARDVAIMEVVSSCNIACGGHAGSPMLMRKMLRAAKDNKIRAGAHPSYPDRENFGRKSMKIESDRLASCLSEQIQLLIEIAAEENATLHHLKPHGALYNDAQDDELLADILVRLADENKLELVSMSGSAVEKKAGMAKIPFIAEAFIDRRYDYGGRLVPRSEAGALIDNELDRMEQGLALADHQAIVTNDGKMIKIVADSLCLHSDSDGALDSARSMRKALEKKGFLIGKPDQ